MLDTPHLVMTDTENIEHLPKQSDIMREMAQDMSVALYRRYGRAAAAKVLGMPPEELDGLREQGQIGYLAISDDQASFFGCQLLSFLLECVVPAGAESRQRSAPIVSTVMVKNKPTIHPDAELLSVNEVKAILGIRQTKFYDLRKQGQLKTGKIGGRTMVKRSDLQDFIDKRFE